MQGAAASGRRRRERATEARRCRRCRRTGWCGQRVRMRGGGAEAEVGAGVPQALVKARQKRGWSFGRGSL